MRNAVWTNRRVVVLGLGLWSACYQPDVAPAITKRESVSLNSIVAISEPIQPMVGILVPAAEVTLSAPRNARLTQLDVQVGERVRKDTVLAIFDDDEERHAHALAGADLEASRAELDGIEVELQMAREARSESEQLKGIVPGTELRQRRHAEKLLLARQRQAKASVRDRQVHLDYTSAKTDQRKLRAPFAGVLTRRYVDADTHVDEGEPIVRIMSEARRVRFAVEQDRSDSLALGTKVRVRFSNDGLSFVGEVISIAPEIEIGTTLVFAEVQLDGDALQTIRIGTAAQVEFLLHPITDH